MSVQKGVILRWFGLSAALAFSAAALVPGTLVAFPDRAASSSSIIFVSALGLIASVLVLGMLPDLWKHLHGVSSLNLLAVTAPAWTLTGALVFLQRVGMPGSGYLLSYQAAASVMTVISLLAAARLSGTDARSLKPEEKPAGWRDYLMLTKPIVVLLLLVTTLSAMIIAAGQVPPISKFLWTALGGALSAGGASALNQYIDRERDGRMSRTQKRPLPGGRMGGPQAVGFGLLLCIAGFNTLALRVNLLSALMALVGMIYYVLLYSIVLKPTTAQNIVVGGGAGAIPPLVGWAAATNSLSMPAFFLFALIFFWTPPHFWALALLKNKDYERAGVPMFPVVYGEHETRVHILLYAVQLVALTLLLPLAELGSGVYVASAAALGSGFILHAWRLWKHGTNKLAWKLYRYSSTYLALIFAALVVDTLVSL